MCVCVKHNSKGERCVLSSLTAAVPLLLPSPRPRSSSSLGRTRAKLLRPVSGPEHRLCLRLSTTDRAQEAPAELTGGTRTCQEQRKGQAHPPPRGSTTNWLRPSGTPVTSLDLSVLNSRMRSLELPEPPQAQRLLTSKEDQPSNTFLLFNPSTHSGIQWFLHE